MKNMKFKSFAVISTTFLSVGAFSVCIGMERHERSLNLKSNVTEDILAKRDTIRFSEKYVAGVKPLNTFLCNEYMVSDTLCSVNGKTYFYGYDEDGYDGGIYVQDELLCEDPTLTCFPLSSSKTTFLVSTMLKSQVVDFSNPQSVEELRNLTPKFASVNRYILEADSMNRRLNYGLEVDCPKGKSSSEKNTSNWLIKVIDELFVNQINGLEEDLAKPKLDRLRYKGKIEDIPSIAKSVSKRYFSLKRLEYGEDPDEYYASISNNLSLRLINSNGKYVSYQEITYNYNGGAHGYYTQKIRTFDPAANTEIDWDYLFTPGCDKEVLSLFYKNVFNDSLYRESRQDITLEEIKDLFESRVEGSADAKNILPNPGITDAGVIFSFQPYEIGSYADGCFHFIIPFVDLMPYMTERAKKMIGL